MIRASDGDSIAAIGNKKGSFSVRCAVGILRSSALDTVACGSIKNGVSEQFIRNGSNIFLNGCGPWNRFCVITQGPEELGLLTGRLEVESKIVGGLPLRSSFLLFR